MISDDMMVSADSTIFTEGEDVLQIGDDGLFYLGVVVEVEDNGSGCLVRFGDRSERWSPLSRLKRLQEDPEEDSPLNKPLVKEKENSIPSRVLEARKELSYDFDSLKWDDLHLRNAQEIYCYCGENGDWYKRMLQCEKCHQWFHQECIRAHTSLLFGDRFWRFICTLCTGTSEEVVERQDMSWTDALHLVLFNLTITYNKKYHDIETSILPFIKSKWKYLVGPNAFLAKSKANANFLASLLQSNRSRFKSGSELKKRSPFWGLRKVAPPHHSDTPLKLESSFLKRDTTLSSRGRRILKPPLPAMKFGGNNSTSKQRLRRRSGGENYLFAAERRDGRGTLDSFIPIPKNFEGLNNPFRCEKDSSTSSNTSSSCSSPNPSESPFCTSSAGQEDGNNFFKDLKSSLNSYFVRNGEDHHRQPNNQFRVLARRLTSSGEVQYLVDRNDSHIMDT